MCAKISGTLDIKETRKKINKSLKKNYFYHGREWPYKDVKPRIIIEKYMEDKETKELRDYKVYCVNGKADYLLVCMNRNAGNTKFFFFDRNWKLKERFTNDGIKDGKNISIKKPENLQKMFEFAEKLSGKIPFLRVDFYECNRKLYFGELTFYPSSGFDINRRLEIDKYLSDNLKLER